MKTKPTVVFAVNVVPGWSLLIPGYGWRKITDVRGWRENRVTIECGYRADSYAYDRRVKVIPYRDVLLRRFGHERARYDSDDFDSGKTIVARWRTMRDARRDEVLNQARTIYDTYCQHEHDCCGNTYYNVVDAVRVKRGEWAIIIRGQINL
jgi:hypothetical protein